eukprot:14446348-Alexandrium_andersonii.AAC.1
MPDEPEGSVQHTPPPASNVACQPAPRVIAADKRDTPLVPVADPADGAPNTARGRQGSTGPPS